MIRKHSENTDVIVNAKVLDRTQSEIQAIQGLFKDFPGPHLWHSKQQWYSTTTASVMTDTTV